MSGKWTKGPWSVDGPPWNQIVWSSAENRVCFLAHSDGLDDERDIATGHLIAAAPDLAEALVEAREVILSLKNSRWSEAEGSDSDWVGFIDAALLKATGE